MPTIGVAGGGFLGLAFEVTPGTYCVDEKTEILTRSGWKVHYDLTESEMVLTINPETQLSEWQPVQGVHRFDGVHEMMRFERDDFSAFVTANHRWLVRHKLPGGVVDWRFKTTDKLRIGYDTLPGAALCADIPTEPKYTDAFVELVAWYWTEGNWDASANPPHIRLSQSIAANSSNCARIRAALDATPDSWSGRPVVTGLGKMHQYNLRAGLSRAIRAEVSDQDKVVRPEFITSLTKAQLELFVYVSTVLADGHLSKLQGAGVGRYDVKPRTGISQAVKARLDSLQMAYSLLGVRTHLIYRRRTCDWYLSVLGRKYFAPRRTDSSGGWYRDPREQFKGTVWCPTTENGTWYARRNGTTYFTGNTAPTKFHEILGETLEWQPNNIFRRPIRQTVDQSGPVPGNVGSTGTITAEAFDDVLVYYLYAMRMSIVKTGTTPNWVYTCTPTSNVIFPTRTLSITVVRNGIVFGYVGCVVSKMTLSVQNDMFQMDTDVLFQNETVQSLPTPTWTTETPYGPGQWNIGIPTATQVFDMDTFSYSIDEAGASGYRLKNTGPNAGRGAQFISLAERTIQMTASRDFFDRTDYNAFQASTSQDITIAAISGANNGISFELPQVVKSAYQVPLGAQGDIVRASLTYDAVNATSGTLVGSATQIIVKTQETIT
jgi:hypothetical protein